jgi:hypothetical protein
LFLRLRARATKRAFPNWELYHSRHPVTGCVNVLGLDSTNHGPQVPLRLAVVESLARARDSTTASDIIVKRFLPLFSNQN